MTIPEKGDAGMLTRKQAATIFGNLCAVGISSERTDYQALKLALWLFEELDLARAALHAGAEGVEGTITPEMLAAGIEAWGEWSDSDDWRRENLVAEIYRRMKALAPSPLPASGLFATLTTEQQARVLAYQGPENHGVGDSYTIPGPYAGISSEPVPSEQVYSHTKEEWFDPPAPSEQVCPTCNGTGFILDHPAGVPFSQTLAAMGDCPVCNGTGRAQPSGGGK